MLIQPRDRLPAGHGGGALSVWGSMEAMDTPGSPVVVALRIAPGRRLPMKAVDEVDVETARGIVGDRYHGARHRQVTVQSAERLEEAAAELGRPVLPEGTRRNVTISQGHVPTAPGSRIGIGDVELEVVRVAAPCRIMDDEIGPGAMEALRRRAGSVCRVLAGGRIRVGDDVRLQEADPDARPGSSLGRRTPDRPQHG